MGILFQHKSPQVSLFYRLKTQLIAQIAPRRLTQRLADQFMRPVRHRRPEWEEQVLLTGRATKSKAGLCLWRWGETKPHQVLLVHGWSGRGSQLGRFVEPLSQAGFGVSLLDGPAHGSSPGEFTHMADFAQHLKTLAQEFGPFYAAVGHSFGGSACILAMSQGLTLRALVLIGSPSNVQEILDRFLESFGLQGLVKKEFQKIIEKRVKADISQFQLNELVRKIKTKGLIVHDQQDKEVPFQDAKELKQNWGTASLLKTSGLGHRRILGDPRVISSVVEFILEKIE